MDTAKGIAQVQEDGVFMVLRGNARETRRVTAAWILLRPLAANISGESSEVSPQNCMVYALYAPNASVTQAQACFQGEAT